MILESSGSFLSSSIAIKNHVDSGWKSQLNGESKLPGPTFREVCGLALLKDISPLR